MIPRACLGLVTVALACGAPPVAEESAERAVAEASVPLVGGRDACADDDGTPACPETPDAAAPQDVPAFVATLDAQSRDAWRAHILPADDELAWASIPWEVTFADGLAAARQQGKPLLMWAMNGHPLGCT